MCEVLNLYLWEAQVAQAAIKLLRGYFQLVLLLMGMQLDVPSLCQVKRILVDFVEKKQQ